MQQGHQNGFTAACGHRVLCEHAAKASGGGKRRRL